jgi:hypothetical protein
MPIAHHLASVVDKQHCRKQRRIVNARNPAVIKPITAQVAAGAETEEDGLEAAGRVVKVSR